MKSISLTPEVADVLRRVIWFESPERAIEYPARVVAYTMTFGTYRDVEVLREQLTDDELCVALDHAPPGIFDPRSWAYWNLKLGRYPAPPLPQRNFPESQPNQGTMR